MKRTTKKRTWKQTLEWLCEGEEYDYLWQLRDGERQLNCTKLASEITEKTKVNVNASTLYRAYVGSTDSISDNTIHTLSLFFEVPAAVIRGEITVDSALEWGMDITISEIKMMKEMRELTPDGRALVRQAIRTLRELQDPPIVGDGKATIGLRGNVTKFPSQGRNKNKD